MAKRSWPVFFFGLVCLLVLIGWPGWVTLQRTQQLYLEMQRIQQSFAERQQAIQDINQRILYSSILIRDYLLDSSPAAGERYGSQYEGNREAIARRLVELRPALEARNAGPLRRMEDGLRQHHAGVMPVFSWPPEEKTRRATYFLRTQQRPRREALLAISREIAQISERLHEERTLEMQQEQEEFRSGLRTLVLLAIAIGVAVSAVAVLRIRMLEVSRVEYERQLRELSSRVIRAQEEERRVLSRELHDEVGQMLTGLRLELGALERLRQDDGRFRERLAEAKELTEQTMRMVRELAMGLRPSVLDDLGLGPALRAQAREFTRRTGKAVAVEILGEACDLPEAHRICLYRLVQEALTNCARHSSATAVQVRLNADASRLVLMVQDNGEGFDPKARRGFGLVGMEERVRELGGQLEVHSAIGGGVRLRAELPLQAEVEQ